MRTFVATLSLLAILAPAAFADDAAPTGPPPEPATSPPPAVSTSPSGATPGWSPNSRVAPPLKGPTVWGVIPWESAVGFGYGVGIRYMMPLPITSILANLRTTLRDSWAIEFGADLLHWTYPVTQDYDLSRTEILPVVGMTWNVWLLPNLAVYPKVELGWGFDSVSYTGTAGTGYVGSSYGGVFYDGLVGIMYMLPSNIALRAEAGSDGVKGGVAWLF